MEHVEGDPARHRKAQRNMALAAALGVLLIGGGGVAVATGVLPLPGADVVTPVASSVTQSGTGTGTVELGSPPVGATVIEIKLTCLTAGTFQTDDGATLVCEGRRPGERDDDLHLPVVPGQHSTPSAPVRARRRHLVATYSDVTTTHGEERRRASPTALPTTTAPPTCSQSSPPTARPATCTAKPASSRADEHLQTGASPSKPIQLPVYTSDGHTVVGQFITNGAPAASTP